MRILGIVLAIVGIIVGVVALINHSNHFVTAATHGTIYLGVAAAVIFIIGAVLTMMGGSSAKA